MIKISTSTKRAIKAFNQKEWHGVDIEHYGKPVEWNEQSFIFKATEGDQILGAITGKHESGVIYIGGLIVASEYRGKGIGKLLLKKVEAFARKHQAHKLHLLTGKGWVAEKFYEALGFEKVADLPMHHFKRDFVVYEKLLE